MDPKLSSALCDLIGALTQLVIEFAKKVKAAK
jgi:hypothetical protein